MTRPHVIEQAVLDIEFDSEDTAFAQQPVLSAFMTNRLMSVMEDVVAEFSSTDLVVQIDALAVDLGTLTSATLLDDMTARFRAQFRSAVQEQLQVLKAGVSDNGRLISQARSASQQIEHFLCTGHLPWQASPGQDRSAEALLLSVIQSNSESLAHVLTQSARRGTMITRLVSQFRETILADLLRALVPSQAGLLLSCLEELRSTLRHHHVVQVTEAELNTILWERLLNESVSHQGAEGILHRWLKSIATQLAQRDGGDATRLLAQLRDQTAQLERQTGGRTALSDVLQVLRVGTENEWWGSSPGLSVQDRDHGMGSDMQEGERPDFRLEDRTISAIERPGEEQRGLPEPFESARHSQAVIQAYDLYERLRVHLLQDVEPSPDRHRVDDLAPLLETLSQHAPWHCQQLVQDLQAGAYPWPPIAARLSSVELRQVLKIVLICLQPMEEGRRTDLLRAVDRSAAQAASSHRLYSHVIESLLRNQPIDTDELLTTIRPIQDGESLSEYAQRQPLPRAPSPPVRDRPPGYETVQEQPLHDQTPKREAQVSEAGAARGGADPPERSLFPRTFDSVSAVTGLSEPASHQVAAEWVATLQAAGPLSVEELAWMVHTLDHRLLSSSDRLRPLLESIFADRETASRLIAQLPEQLLTRLLYLLRPSTHAYAQRVADLLVTAGIGAARTLDPPSLRRVTWQLLFRTLLEERNAFDVDTFVRRFIVILADLLAQPDHASVRAQLRLQLAHQSLRPTSIDQRTLTALLHTPHADRRSSAPVKSDKDLVDDDASNCTESIYIVNAGQVLASAYLPRLFGMLNLTEQNAFRDAASARRAVHLIQFMVNESVDSPEHHLVLNKILCGMNTGAPIERTLAIQPVEQEAIEGMLRSMIQHWTVLGHTSIAGFRESFLQREGQLRLQDDAWHLLVEPRAFDMLLDQIPWSFTTIKYPWMDRVLYVEWR